MIVFPNAKLNIGLNVTNKREDGFHDIETIFYPIPLTDVLEVVENKNLSNGEYTYKSIGIEVDCAIEDNIIIKAYKLIHSRYEIPGVDIHFKKTIPYGGGLGGGSSDGAFMLKLLNELFSLDISIKELESMALELGSDCPFFINNQPVYATGRGEIFENISFNINDKFMVLVKPQLSVPTALAYKGIQPKESTFDLRLINEINIKDWKDKVCNDFEKTVFKEYKQISEIKNKLYNLGAEYTSMTGSGATVFAIFNNPVDLKDKFDNCFYWSSQL